MLRLTEPSYTRKVYERTISLIRRNINTIIFKFNLIKSRVRVRLGLRLRFRVRVSFLVMYITGFRHSSELPDPKLYNASVLK